MLRAVTDLRSHSLLKGLNRASSYQSSQIIDLEGTSNNPQNLQYKIELPRLRRPSDGQIYSLQGITIVGRNVHNDIPLRNEPGVSREHARFCQFGDQVTVVDLGSTNGITINNVPLTGKAVLMHGDVLVFDVEEFVFENCLSETGDGNSDVNAESGGSIQELSASVSIRTNSSSTSQEQWDPFKRFVTGMTRIMVNPVHHTSMLLSATTTTYTVPVLKVVGGVSVGKTIGLADSKIQWKIGSGENQDITLAEAGVSSSHAVIKREDGNIWRLVDELSQNGTYVNGEKKPDVYLANGTPSTLENFDVGFFWPMQKLRAKEAFLA